MRYEINNKNVISIFDENKSYPFLLQPTWPDNTEWADSNEAKNWAELMIESMQNPQSEFLPGLSPKNHPRPRPKLDTEA